MDRYKYLIPLFLLTLGPTVHAFSSFKPECSKPEESVNFVSAPKTRGTLSIFWNCLFTIIACTWSVHYLNVPQQRDGRDPGKIGDFRWSLRGVRIHLRWMVVTIIAPEYILLKALERRSTCKMATYSLNSYVKTDCVPWSLTHSHFAHMGGFVIRHGVPDPVLEPILRVYGAPIPQYETSSEDVHDLSERGANIPGPQPAAVEIAENQVVEEKDIVKFQADNYPALPNPFHLSLGALTGLRLDGLLRLPRIYEEELKDRSKSDIFTKVVALFQIFITVVDVVIRTIRGLPISQLEVAVIAFAFCAVLIHVACWDSPQDVSSAVTWVKYDGPIPDNILGSIVRFQGQEPDSGQPLDNNMMLDPIGWAMLQGLLGNMIFAGLHLLAWNSAFPTFYEAVAWRLTTLFCVGICFWWFLIFGFSCIRKIYHRTRSISPEGISMNIFQKILVFPSLAIYVVARLFLVVESFRALAFLPPDSYVATWAANFPWFG